MKEIAIEILVVVITVVIPILTGYVVSYIGKAKERIQTATTNAILQEYEDEIARIVTMAVTTVSQTFVDGLKAGGEFTIEQQKDALRQATAICYKTLTLEAQRFLEETYNDVGEYLKYRIEAEVKRQKDPAIIDTSAIASSTAAAKVAQTAIEQIASRFN